MNTIFRLSWFSNGAIMFFSQCVVVSKRVCNA
jgi:hypothetical protein